MKVYVINLRKNEGRMKRLADRLSRLGIDYVRIEAIYGKELSLKDKKDKVNHFRWWCTKGYKIRDGEIGCTLSHNLIYEIMVKEGVWAACILEDDAVLDDHFPFQLQNVERFLRSRGKESIVVQLANHSGTKALDWEIKKIEDTSYAEAYAINLAAAKHYLSANSPICAPVDMWGYWQKKGIFSLYQAYPGVCEQDWTPGFVSDVCPVNAFDAKKLPIIKRLAWKIKRAIGFAIDRIFFHA